MMSGVRHLDQRNPEKIETDEWARGVSTTLFQHISFQLQLISVWRMVGVSQGETMSQQRLCQAPLSFPCHDNLKDTSHQDQLYRPCSVVTCNAPDFLIAHWFPKLRVCSISSRSSILPVVLTMWLELTTNLGQILTFLKDVRWYQPSIDKQVCSGRGKIWQELSFCLSGCYCHLIPTMMLISSPADKCRKTCKEAQQGPQGQKGRKW